MFEELESYAELNHVPIIRKEGWVFLEKCIRENDVKSCLEVGTAIGYSAIKMASLGVFVTTLERNQEMYDKAQENIGNYGLEDSIESVFTDALEYVPTRKYDLLFIDAAKAQNRKFFLRFTPFINDGGIIVVDNLNFHGLTEEGVKIESRNVRAMVRKINEFKDWLKENEEYDTIFTDMGDGMSLSKRK